jgi:hypothetical protein
MSRPPIYTDGLTKQRRWQLKKAAQGLCITCGRAANGSKLHCKKHQEAFNRNKRDYYHRQKSMEGMEE